MAVKIIHCFIYISLLIVLCSSKEIYLTTEGGKGDLDQLRHALPTIQDGDVVKLQAGVWTGCTRQYAPSPPAVFSTVYYELTGEGTDMLTGTVINCENNGALATAAVGCHGGKISNLLITHHSIPITVFKSDAAFVLDGVHVMDGTSNAISTESAKVQIINNKWSMLIGGLTAIDSKVDVSDSDVTNTNSSPKSAAFYTINSTISISRTTIRYNSGYNGAITMSDSTLTMRGCTVSDNHALQGISAVICTIDIHDTQFSNNTAGFTAAAAIFIDGPSRLLLNSSGIRYHEGLAVYLKSEVTATMLDTQISKISGTAIHAASSSLLAMNHCDVSLNEAPVIIRVTDSELNVIDSKIANNQGCAIDSTRSQCSLFNNMITGHRSSAITLQNSTFSAIGNTFSDNHAMEYNNGGAILGTDTQMHIESNIFDSNTANAGGAIMTNGNVNNTYTNNVFRQCQSVADGAAVYMVKGLHLFVHNEFVSNNASDDGGALYANNVDSLQVLTSSFISNTAAYNGGGVALDHSRFFSLTDSAFENNTASEANGGAIAMMEQYTASVVIFNSTLSNNKAKLGGAIYTSGAEIEVKMCNFVGQTSVSAALYVDKTSLMLADTAFSMNHGDSVASAVLVYNSTAKINHVSFANNEGAGGAVHIDQSTVSVMTCDFTENKAPTDANGGAMTLDQSTLMMVSSTMTGNSAGNGGAVFGSMSNLRFEDVTFDSNMAYGDAGALLFISSTVSITDVNCRACSATGGHGGCAHLIGVMLDVQGFVIDGCSCSGHGGGIRAEDTDGTMNSVTITNSHVSGNAGIGGAMSINDNSVIQMTDISLSLNTAHAAAGALACEQSTVSIVNLTCESNVVIEGRGGCLSLVGKAVLSLRSGDIRHNTAVHGGGVHMSDSHLDMTDTAIIDNSVYGVMCEDTTSMLFVGQNSVITTNKEQQVLQCSVHGNGVIADEYLAQVIVPGMDDNVILGGYNVTLYGNFTANGASVKLGSIDTNVFVQSSSGKIELMDYMRPVNDEGYITVTLRDGRRAVSKQKYKFPAEDGSKCNVRVISGPLPNATYTGTHPTFTYSLDVSCPAHVSAIMVMNNVPTEITTSGENNVLIFRPSTTFHTYTSVRALLEMTWPKAHRLSDEFVFYYPMPTDVHIINAHMTADEHIVTVCGLYNLYPNVPRCKFNSSTVVEGRFSTTTCVHCPLEHKINCQRTESETTDVAVSISEEYYAAGHVIVTCPSNVPEQNAGSWVWIVLTVLSVGCLGAGAAYYGPILLKKRQFEKEQEDSANLITGNTATFGAIQSDDL